jgi:hypothetical protein
MKKSIIVIIASLYSFLGINMPFAAANPWTQKADIGGIERVGAVGFSIGNKGYIGMGEDASYVRLKDFWEYDPVANTWTQKADFGRTARVYAVGFTIGSKGYVGTGHDSESIYTQDFWEYDPVVNTWTQKADFGGGGRTNATGFSIGSKGYIGMGRGNGGLKLDFWEHDPAANTWTVKADFGGGLRGYAVGFSIGSKGYVGTGSDDSSLMKDFWEYDPTANTWTAKADLGGGLRQNAVGFPIGSKGYVGTGGSVLRLKDFWEYDPAANTWTAKADFRGTARYAAVGFSIGSKGYVGTGWDTSSSSERTKDFWEYDPATPADYLYFPHIATTFGWQTEIAIVNTSGQTVTGTLRALSNAGVLVDSKDVTLSAHGRSQINVANTFTDHANIGYIIFDSSSSTVQGYTKFYIQGVYRAAIPAVKEIKGEDIHISHIASDAAWWTGISLVNTTSSQKVLTITFNNGQVKTVPLNANEHKAFDIASLFDNQPQPGIVSAVITNASGVVGLELFGRTNNKQLDGILLTGNTTPTIYYPHVASNNEWWTGIVAYNPSESACAITITPFSDQGIPLPPLTPPPIPAKGKYIGAVSALGLPTETAWFRIDSTQPITGFELFGTTDGEQLASYAGGIGTGQKTGVFAKIEKSGWTGIAFVNTEDTAASVTLTAYKDNGDVVATQVLPPVGGHAKVVRVAEAIFLPQNISDATYIAYSSDRNVVGFQLNGSSDWTMLDGLPGM